MRGPALCVLAVECGRLGGEALEWFWAPCGREQGKRIFVKILGRRAHTFRRPVRGLCWPGRLQAEGIDQAAAALSGSGRAGGHADRRGLITCACRARTLALLSAPLARTKPCTKKRITAPRAAGEPLARAVGHSGAQQASAHIRHPQTCRERTKYISQHMRHAKGSGSIRNDRRPSAGQLGGAL